MARNDINLTPATVPPPILDTDVENSNKPKKVNPDAITGAPGSHPVGTGIGAVAAGAAGAAIGSVVPGVGTVLGGVVGTVVGAVSGGLAGKGIAEAINPTAEEAYWRDEYRNRPYYRDDYSFDDDYAPAYRYGYDLRARHSDVPLDQLDDSEMRTGWEKAKVKSRLEYEHAKQAIQDSWQRWDEWSKSKK